VGFVSPVSDDGLETGCPLITATRIMARKAATTSPKRMPTINMATLSLERREVV
jgi:hypothetical protein